MIMDFSSIQPVFQLFVSYVLAAAVCVVSGLAIVWVIALVIGIFKYDFV